MAKARWTEIVYHDVNVPGLFGRVARVDGGLRIWSLRWSPFAYQCPGPLVIPDDDIVQFFVGRAAVRIVFRGDDEVVMRNNVLADFGATLPAPVADEAGGRGYGLTRRMQRRQRALGRRTWTDR